MDASNKNLLFLGKNAFFILWIFISLTLVVGAVYSYFLGDFFRFYDEKEYYIIAQNIVQKGVITINGVDPSAWRPPGYPIWLSFFIFLGGNIFVLRLVNFALLGFSLWLVYKILEKRSKVTALVGVLLTLFYPLFFFTASTLYPQTFVTTLFLLTLYLLFNEKGTTYKTALIVGIIYGILTLSVVTFLGSLFLTMIWMTLRNKGGWKKSIVMLTATVLVLTPWTIRNYLVFDSFVFIANNGGIAFNLGNGPNTQPNTWTNGDLPKFDKTKVKNEVEINRLYKSSAMEYIRTHKWASFKMYLLKFLNNFNFSNTLMTKSQMSIFRDSLLFVTYYTLLGLAIIGCVMANKLRFSSKEWYLVALYIGQGLLLALFITRIRYRLPFDPILPLIGAPALSYFIFRKK